MKTFRNANKVDAEEPPIIENGAIFEKGGVNTSSVYGSLPLEMQQYLKVSNVDFFACGPSQAIHPKNPMIPTAHANYRYFEMYDKTGKIIDQWFGGGQDLTPYYLLEEGTKHFRRICKKVCNQLNSSFWAKFKKQCDGYIWNLNREEARGIGGFFFGYCRDSK